MTQKPPTSLRLSEDMERRVMAYAGRRQIKKHKAIVELVDAGLRAVKRLSGSKRDSGEEK